MSRRDIIAIGGSLGAVEAVKRLCRELPGDLAAALFITVHVGARGRNMLAEIFNQQSAIAVSTAVDGAPFHPGHAYVAPADHHLLVMDDVIRLGRGPRENMSRPAIDPLFRSVAASFGSRVIAVVLTGALNDGASGLADVKRCGGVTVVQNPRDAFAPDMPSEALQSSDVDYRAPLADMAALLVQLSREDAGPTVKIPADIPSEVEIALGRAVISGLPEGLSDFTPLSCPACGGVLSQMRQGPPLRFRCQVGHGYTAEALVTAKEGSVDEAMRVALRILNERVVLTAKMAEEARYSGRHAAAASYEQRLEESEAHAEMLRRAISGTQTKD